MESSQAKETETMTDIKDTAKQIRKILKSQYGLTSKQVSVRISRFSMGESINATVKTPLVPLPLVDAIMQQYSEIRRDERTGEILGGGNTYTGASYETGCLDELAEMFEGLIEPGFRFGQLEVVDKRDGWYGIVNTETGGWAGHDIYPDSSAPHTFAYAVAASGVWASMAGAEV